MVWAPVVGCQAFNALWSTQRMRRRRLLDEVDAVSAVSGGSVTAASFALYGDRLLADVTQRFLHRDIEADFAR